MRQGSRASSRHAGGGAARCTADPRPARSSAASTPRAEAAPAPPFFRTRAGGCHHPAPRALLRGQRAAHPHLQAQAPPGGRPARPGAGLGSRRGPPPPHPPGGKRREHPSPAHLEHRPRPPSRTRWRRCMPSCPTPDARGARGGSGRDEWRGSCTYDTVKAILASCRPMQ